MKRTVQLLCFIFLSLHVIAQNTPVVEKGAPSSNNTLPSNGTLGSNSGVNPMGNPGTIISNGGNNSANSTLTPHPNVEPGTFLTSSPQGTVTTTTVTTGTVTQKTAAVSGTTGTVTAVVKDSTEIAIAKKAPVTRSPEKESIVIKSTPEATVSAPVPANKQLTVTDKGKSIPAYTPVRGNYVSERIINNINTKYGGDVYDIRTVRIAANNKIAYIVRLVQNGKFKSEVYYDEP